MHVISFDSDAEGLFVRLDVLLHGVSDVGDEVGDELGYPAVGQ